MTIKFVGNPALVGAMEDYYEHQALKMRYSKLSVAHDDTLAQLRQERQIRFADHTQSLKRYRDAIRKTSTLELIWGTIYYWFFLLVEGLRKVHRALIVREYEYEEDIDK